MSDNFWATLLGAFIAFLGVVLSLQRSQKNHEQSLAHERIKRKEEREFRARQEVFAEVAAALARFMGHFTSIPDIPLQSVGSSSPGMHDLGVAFNRLQLYVGNETIESAMELNRLIAISMANAISDKIPAANIAAKIEGLDATIRGLESLISGMREEVKAMLQSGQDSQVPGHRKIIGDQYRKIGELQVSRTELVAAMRLETEKCRDSVMMAYADIIVAQSKLLILFRKELGFDLDNNRYLEIIEKHNAEALSFLARWKENALARAASEMSRP